MRRRYLLLLGLVVLGALSLGVVLRLPHRSPAPHVAVAPDPGVELTLTIEDGRISPATSAVPKDRRVLLAITNRGKRDVDLKLAGYEDRLSIGTVAAGDTWSGEFVADLPGAEFTWLVNGEPAGLFAVTGSHLVEGHR